MNIKISYDGGYPNLCYGTLIVYLDDVKYKFPAPSLYSGGNCLINSNGDEDVTKGDWEILNFPDNFPIDEEIRKAVLDLVNETIPHGCCGGCI